MGHWDACKGSDPVPNIALLKGLRRDVSIFLVLESIHCVGRVGHVFGRTSTENSNARESAASLHPHGNGMPPCTETRKFERSGKNLSRLDYT